MKMTSRDRFGIILSHFVGFSLKETAEIFSLSTSCVTNDRSRKKEVWRTGYRLTYQEQIEALKYSVEFTKEPYDLSSFHGHLSDIYASLNTLLLYEDLPKKFKPPEIWTQALAHHLPTRCPPLPSPSLSRIMIEFPSRFKGQQIQRRHRYLPLGADIVSIPTESRYEDTLFERFEKEAALFNQIDRETGEVIKLGLEHHRGLFRRFTEDTSIERPRHSASYYL